jgi:hypothetical protein
MASGPEAGTPQKTYPFKSFRFPPLREGNRKKRAYSVPPASRGNLKEGVINCCFLNSGSAISMIRVQASDTKSLGQARFFALTPFVSLSRRRARGSALQGAPPCAPTPLAHEEPLGAPPCAPTPLAYSMGEGLGVKAKQQVHSLP